MKLLLVTLLFSLSGYAFAIAHEGPTRIVSLNLCADQYLIALADKEKVAALTDNARDHTISYFADRAEEWPVSAGAAEEVLAMKPDLVIASRFRGREVRAFLKDQGVEILEIQPAYTFQDIKEQILEIGSAIGEAERSERLLQDIETRLDDIAPESSQFARTAAHYQQRGYVSGSRTLMSEIMTRVGLINIADTLNAGRTSRVSIETLLASRPDYLITNSQSLEVRDLGSELIEHPALSSIYGPDRRLQVPDAMTICGGPSFPAAVEHLQQELRRASSLTG